jgi:hypothetical protein
MLPYGQPLNVRTEARDRARLFYLGRFQRYKRSMNIRDAKSCKFDLMSLGECMIRLSPPGHGRIEFANALEVWVGGGDGCRKFPSIRPRASGRLRDGKRHAASRSVPQSMGVCWLFASSPSRLLRLACAPLT